MIRRSMLGGFPNKQQQITFSKRWGKMAGLKVSEQAGNVQRKTLQDVSKASRTVAQDHF